MMPESHSADKNLARRLELCSSQRAVRYTEAYQRLHPEARTAVLPAAGGFATYVGPGSPLNSTRALGFDRPVTGEDLERVEDFFFSRGEPARVHLCPLADGSLLALLGERGYKPLLFFSVLACEIPGGFTAGPLPPGIAITRAEPHQADLWVTVTGQGFESRDAAPVSPEAADILGPNFHAADSAAFFAWSLDEQGRRQPAGGGGMYIAPAERAIELGGASTRPAFRRRGIQRALIEARLAEAARLGCDLAVVLTEPAGGSQRNLARAGFWLAYTKLVMAKSPTGE